MTGPPRFPGNVSARRFGKLFSVRAGVLCRPSVGWMLLGALCVTGEDAQGAKGGPYWCELLLALVTLLLPSTYQLVIAHLRD